MEREYDFFISYAKKDIDWALWITSVLNEHGYSVFLDIKELVVGSDWAGSIAEALSHSNRFICIWSGAHATSSHCRVELEYALDLHTSKGMAFYPVRIEDVGLPISLQNFHCIDLFQREEWIAEYVLLPNVTQKGISGGKSAEGLLSFLTVPSGKSPKRPRDHRLPFPGQKRPEADSRPATGDKKEVFISYHRESGREIRERVVTALEQDRIFCWYDERDVGEGHYAEKIARAIAGCQIFLLILDEGTNDSIDVLHETELAFQRLRKRDGIRLLPFRVDDAPIGYGLSYYLAGLDRVDLRHAPNDGDIRRLVGRVKDLLRR